LKKSLEKASSKSLEKSLRWKTSFKSFQKLQKNDDDDDDDDVKCFVRTDVLFLSLNN
jgi:hypothetical protein